MTIEKKGGNTISANEADKKIRKLVDDNPVMTKSKNILNEIDRLKKDGKLPVKKAMGGRIGYKMGSKGCGKAKTGKGRAYGKNS